MSTLRRRSNKGEGLPGKRVLLIVTGGIAAYKSAYLSRLLIRKQAELRVVMTEAATKFVTPLTFEVLSGNPVGVDLFAQRVEPRVEHVELAGWADIIIVAPATADFIAKAALGLADDLASTVLLASRSPVLFAPAMNQAMWKSAAVRRNIERLKSDGRLVVDPRSGDLACGEEGPGRMAEPEDILRAVEGVFGAGELSGLKVLVTVGRTEEDIDSVRFITNRSSGRMGFALAREMKRRGAVVHVIRGAVDVETPQVDSVKVVKSAKDMARAVKRAFPSCDVLFMTAAVADFTPSSRAKGKIKRGDDGLTIELKPTEDILASLSGVKKKEQVVVGFALETKEDDSAAMAKLKAKACDYLVLNLVGGDTGFSVPTNSVVIYGRKGRILSTPLLGKDEIASEIIDAVVQDRRIKRKING